MKPDQNPFPHARVKSHPPPQQIEQHPCILAKPPFDPMASDGF